MDIESRLALIRSVGEEIITEDELRGLLEAKAHPVAYDGFEPSGLAHLPFGVFRPLLLKDMLKAGVKFKIWLANYFAWINNKMGGDLDAIHKVGEYFIEVWKAAGVDPDKVDFVWASECMDSEYWKKVILIAKATTVNRATRALNIMGRKEGEMKEVAQYFYPMMQAADPFKLGVDINQLGLDQRRAGMLSREAADRYKWKKPVIVSHHMLMGLEGLKQPDRTSNEYSTTAKAVNEFLDSSKKIETLFGHINSNVFSGAGIDLGDRKVDLQEIKKASERIKEVFSENLDALNIPLRRILKPWLLRLDELLEITKAIRSDTHPKDKILQWSNLIGEIRSVVGSSIRNEMNEEIRAYNESFDSKMSKSKPNTCIFMHDTAEQIKTKLNSAYCPAKTVENNPILDYAKHIIFRASKTMEIERSSNFGGNISFSSYQELEDAFRKGNLHPADLKNGVAEGLDKLISPVRSHFENNVKARKLYEFVKNQNITR